MNSAHATSRPDAIKPCRICDEKISHKARKCIHCNSWQDWRGEIGFSSEILSLLISLVTVTTLGTPILLAALASLGSPLAVSVQDVTATQVMLLVANTGSKPATMGPNGFVEVHFGKGVQQLGIGSTPNSTWSLGNLVTLNANSTVPVKYYWVDSGLIGKPPAGATCDVSLPITDFGGQERPQISPFDCRRLPMMMLAPKSIPDFSKKQNN